MITLLLGLLCILLFGAFGPGDLTPLFFIVLALILAAAATSGYLGRRHS